MVLWTGMVCLWTGYTDGLMYDHGADNGQGWLYNFINLCGYGKVCSVGLTCVLYGKGFPLMW